MKTNVEQLEEVIRTEDELAQALLEVLEQQQHSLVHVQTGSVAETSAKAREFTKLIETLEKERWALMSEITGQSPSDAVQGFRSDVNAAELLRHLDAADAVRIKPIIDHFRSTAEQVVRLNETNRRLLEQARHFVRETLRVMTDNYTQQVIDQKM